MSSWLLLGFVVLVAVVGFLIGERFGQTRREIQWKQATEGRLPTRNFEPGKDPRALPYYRQSFLCSDGEFRFYRELVAAVGRDFDVMCKPRVAGVIGCRRDDWAEGYGPPIAMKEFDFILVKKGTSYVAAAVELDDRTHELEHRVERDEFLNLVCETAELPLLRFKIQQRYDRRTIRATVESATKKTNNEVGEAV